MNNAVPNVMKQVKLEENPSIWQKFKDFADSNAGKMVLGGLGTGLAVGLAGGDGKQALAYGLKGAGNIGNSIYRNNKLNEKRYDDALQTALQWRNQMANRQLQKTLQDERIQAQKDLAQTNYNKALALLQDKATIEEQSKKRQQEAEDAYYNDLYVKAGYTPEQITYANLQRKGINQNDMISQMAYNTLYNPNATEKQKAIAKNTLQNIATVNNEINALSPTPEITLGDAVGYAKDLNLSITPESLNTAIASGDYNDLVFEQKRKPLTGDALLIDYFMSNGATFDKALSYANRLTPEQKLAFEQGKSDITLNRNLAIENAKQQNAIDMAGVKYGYEQQGANAELGRNKELKGYEFELGKQKADNALTREQVMADYNAKIKQAQTEYEAVLSEIAKDEALKRDMELAKYKASLPSDRQREITAMSIASGIPEKDIYQQMYNKMVKEGKTQAPTFGQLASAVQSEVITPEMANAEYGANVFKKSTKKQTQEEKAKLQREQQIASVQAVDKQLDEFETLFDSLPQKKLSAYTGGFFRDLTGTLTPEEVEFNARRTLLFNKIARDLGGEKGVLSDQDIKRIEKALPTMYDNPQQRASKLAAIRGLVEIRLNQLNSGMPTEEVEATNSILNVGDIVDGYRYIGGEPSLESSWEIE